MSRKSKKLDVSPPPETENIFDELVKEAAEKENIVKDDHVGAKDGVFVPPEPKKVPERTENVGNKPADLPNAVVPEKELSVEDELKAILNVPKGKRAVPTFVTFYAARSNALRYVIVDITDSIIEDAWKKYIKIMGHKADEEEFMGLLYKITNTDVPRMYRSVGHVTLKK